MTENINAFVAPNPSGKSVPTLMNTDFVFANL